MKRLLSFPNPVNEKAARVVAGVVLAMVLVVLVTGWYWLLVPLAYGFLARVLTGPKLSPLGWIAQNVIAPRLGERKPVPGPPKRFAQGIGAAMSGAALVLARLRRLARASSSRAPGPPTQVTTAGVASAVSVRIVAGFRTIRNYLGD